MAPEPDTVPDIAVVVPVFNDPTGVAATVDSLLVQETDRRFAVHVVDNDSTDRTPEVVRAYDDDYDRFTSHRETDVQSSYAARNTGIEHTDAPTLAFIDADVTVSPDWLDRACDELESSGADYLGCAVDLDLPVDPTLAARFDHHTGFPVGEYLEHQHFVPTCSLFVRREVFADVGLFDHRMISGGDKEFGNRVYAAGYVMDFAEDVTVYHPVRDTLRALVKKDVRVGRGLCQLQRFHPERYGRPGIPPRPSGVKSPDRTLPRRDRLVFSALSTALTGVKGMGYYREYLRHLQERGNPHSDEIPQLNE